MSCFLQCILNIGVRFLNNKDHSILGYIILGFLIFGLLKLALLARLHLGHNRA